MSIHGMSLTSQFQDNFNRTGGGHQAPGYRWASPYRNASALFPSRVRTRMATSQPRVKVRRQSRRSRAGALDALLAGKRFVREATGMPLPRRVGSETILPMSRIETPAANWADLQGPLRVNGAPGQSLAVATAASPQNSEGWQAIIAGPLAEWEKDPSRLEDDGIEAPSRETIQRAAGVARELCAAGLLAPQRVAATGDGGIVFARQEGSSLSNIEVAADGSVELTVFRDSRLVSRQRLG